jgi:hypothetical protein
MADINLGLYADWHRLDERMETATDPRVYVLGRSVS